MTEQREADPQPARERLPAAFTIVGKFPDEADSKRIGERGEDFCLPFRSNVAALVGVAIALVVYAHVVQQLFDYL